MGTHQKIDEHGTYTINISHCPLNSEYLCLRYVIVSLCRRFVAVIAKSYKSIAFLSTNWSHGCFLLGPGAGMSHSVHCPDHLPRPFALVPGNFYLCVLHFFNFADAWIWKFQPVAKYCDPLVHFDFSLWHLNYPIPHLLSTNRNLRNIVQKSYYLWQTQDNVILIKQIEIRIECLITG